MKRADDRLIGVGAHLRQCALQPFARRSEPAEGIIDRGAPISAGDEQARLAGVDQAPVLGEPEALAGASVEARLTQAEDELDDIGNAIGHALATLILEGVDSAARGEEPLFEVFDADHAEMLGRDWLAQSLHRGQELGDAVAIHPVSAEELRQRLVRTADFGQDLALNGGAGEPAKLGNELPHGAALPEIAVSRHMGGEIALQPCLIIPVGAGRIARTPLLPVGMGRLLVDELLAEPGPAHREMWVEPHVGQDEPLDLARRAFEQPNLRPVKVKGELGPDHDQRRRGRVDDLQLVADVIDPELDAVQDAPGLDGRHARPVAPVPAVEHKTHGKKGL